MVYVGEAVKKVLLFLGVVLVLYLIVFITSSFLSKDASEVIENNTEAPKEVLSGEFNETVDFEKDVIASVKPDYIQKGSIKISLDRAYIRDGGEGDYSLYFDISGEDMFLDEDLSRQSGNFFFRSPFLWNAFYMFHIKERHPMLICDYGTEGRFWKVTYCINTDELDEKFFGQTTRFIYTDQSIADLESTSPIAMTKKERTFVFEVVLPKEFTN